jgi:hypothetical protein
VNKQAVTLVVPCSLWSKSVAKKVEARRFVPLLAKAIFAKNNFRFLRMKFQTALQEPLGDYISDIDGLFMRPTV